MFNFAWVFGHHEIDKWRDDFTLMTAATLNTVAGDLITAAEEELKSASWKDGLVAQGSFIASRVAPKLRETAEPVVEHIMQEANRRLAEIVEHQAIWSLGPDAQAPGPNQFEGWQDVAVAAAPLAGGAALAAALPAVAVTTTTAWFGLVTTSVISWPVVLGGGAIVGAAMATGVLNTSKIWEKTESRLRRKMRDFIVGSLLQGTAKQPSILEQVAKALADAAEQAKGR